MDKKIKTPSKAEDENVIRIARPTDLDAVGSLLVASYSSLLATHYDDDLLGRALPHISKAKPDLLACGTCPPGSRTTMIQGEQPHYPADS
jgi:hypothetical protein